jgi:hypothetical protein
MLPAMQPSPVETGGDLNICVSRVNTDRPSVPKKPPAGLNVWQSWQVNPRGSPPKSKANPDARRGPIACFARDGETRRN